MCRAVRKDKRFVDLGAYAKGAKILKLQSDSGQMKVMVNLVALSQERKILDMIQVQLKRKL